MSKQTGSFIFIIVLATAGAIAALQLNQRTAPKLAQINLDQTPLIQHVQSQPQPKPAAEVSVAAADITGWKTYTSRNYPFSFKYPPTWKAGPTPTTDDSDTITITPPDAASAPMRIYLSKTGYLGMDNLQSQPITVGGQIGQNVQDLLVGVTYQNIFYTFDIGTAIKNQAEFNALVQSAVFK